MSLSASIKLILTPEKVHKAEARATRKALIKAGAFVRTNARRSQLRKRKKASAPGNPPNVHTTHPYASLRNIRFALNAKQTAVIVGPLKFSRPGTRRVKPISKTVPETLEKGGSVAVTQRRRDGSVKRKVVRIHQRPFMIRALRQEMPKFAALWRGEFK